MTSQERVDEFNELVWVGDAVFVLCENGNVQETRTRAKAQVLANGEAAVWVEGLLGSFPLEVVSPKISAKTRDEAFPHANG